MISLSLKNDVNVAVFQIRIRIHKSKDPDPHPDPHPYPYQKVTDRNTGKTTGIIVEIYFIFLDLGIILS